MPINSRSKGARGERVAAKLFEKWTKKTFSKTPASGGLHWKKSNVAGDIVCTHEGHYFPFTVEVKNYNKIDFSHLLNPKVKNVDILDFWAQATTDAKRVNKIPLLLMRYSGLPTDFYFVVMSSDLFHKISMLDRLKLRKTLSFWDRDKNIKLTMVPSSEFFKLNYKSTKTEAKLFIKTLYNESFRK